MERNIEIFETAQTTQFEWNQVVKTIEASFKKSLIASFSNDDMIKLLYTQDYSGVAVIKNFNGLIYLDKLAVLEECRGLGLGNALLLKIFEEFPQLIWRASYHNPYISFYYRHCDGLIKSENWIVFWRQYSLDEVRNMIPIILKKPSDFETPAS